MALKNGHRSQNTYQVELASNAEKDGTIIWIPWLRKSSGAQKKSGSCTWITADWATSGLTSLRHWRAELTTPSRTTGTHPWRRRSQRCTRNTIYIWENACLKEALNTWDPVPVSWVTAPPVIKDSLKSLRNSYWTSTLHLLSSKIRCISKTKQESF
jgi:hypothetical protein